MSSREKKALHEKGIKVGDTVRTAYRGGVREGWVRANRRGRPPPPPPPPPGTQVAAELIAEAGLKSSLPLLLLQGGQQDHGEAPSGVHPPPQGAGRQGGKSCLAPLRCRSAPSMCLAWGGGWAVPMLNNGRAAACCR
jgi:hypothetical protein